MRGATPMLEILGGAVKESFARKHKICGMVEVIPPILHSTPPYKLKEW